MIGYGENRYLKRKNCTINLNLVEDGWYHIPSNLLDIPAKSYSGERPDFVGKVVTKEEFMKIMGSMSRMLIRTKYHTDQLEGTYVNLKIRRTF